MHSRRSALPDSPLQRPLSRDSFHARNSGAAADDLSPMVLRTAARSGAVLGAAAVLAVVGAGPASAHVTANPETAEAGSYSVITFRVPTESSTAGTVGLTVTMPTDKPVVSARTEPIPGWTAKVVKAPLAAPVTTPDGGRLTQAVRQITWTAAPGVRIGPTEFAEFRVSAGPLPSTPGPLVMPATQTYSDGKVVRWSDPPGPTGSPEPEHPAPTVQLVADEPAPDGAAGQDAWGRWLGVGGLVLGLIGAVCGTVALVRTRRQNG